jgi:CheY-like chemotaxis protein
VALVLVVDDETNLRQLTADLLSCNGYEVVQACHGMDGLAQLCEHSPDLVILDLNMPVMDGWQFRAEQLRHPDGRLTGDTRPLADGRRRTARSVRATKGGRTPQKAV